MPQSTNRRMIHLINKRTLLVCLGKLQEGKHRGKKKLNHRSVEKISSVKSLRLHPAVSATCCPEDFIHFVAETAVAFSKIFKGTCLITPAASFLQNKLF